VREARSEGLSQRHRFHARGAFGPALRSARKLRGKMALIHVAPARPGVSRLGIALTRRVAPSSVQRNRIKRMVRELFRRHPAKRAGLDLVVTLREAAGRVDAKTLSEEIRALLDQAVAPPER
jgi:ribonuclease P protein component